MALKPAFSVLMSTRVTILLLVAILSFEPGTNTAQAQLPVEVLTKVKRGTVHLKVKRANGSTAEGSGWFVEPGMIITNAHVLNMHGGDKRFPQKIDVTIDAGAKTSQTFTAKFQGAAYEADLMLLKVDADPEKLPEPLELHSEAELSETQSVYVFGFPLGKSPGKSISVSKSSISSLRRDDGQLKEIQLEGGVNPGNSGGPVVTSEGEVIGVAVGGVEGTSIKFAIPVEFVSQLVNGKFLNLKLEQSYLSGDQIKLPVKVATLDPLNRITDIKIEHWTTPKIDTTPRPGSYELPEPVEGDGPVQVVETHKLPSGISATELVLAPLPDETSTYFLRATLKDGRGRTYWSTPISNLRPVPLEHREIRMKYQTKPGPGRAFQISHEAAFKVQVGTRSDTMSMSVRVEAQPTWSAPDADGDTVGKLNFSSVTLGLKQNGEPVKAAELFNPLGQAFLKTSGSVRMSEEGAVVFAQSDFHQTDPNLKSELLSISDLVMQTMELLSVPFPQHTLQIKERIRTQRMLLIGLTGLYLPSQADVKYQYQGVRKKYQEETAFFDISGELRPRRGDDSRLTGRLNGVLEVSLETGQVISSSCTMNVDFESLENGGRLIGTLSAKLNAIDPRPKSSLAPKDLEALTILVPADSRFTKGQTIYAFLEKSWQRGEVLAVNDAGQPKVHFIGWSDFWDAWLPNSRIRLVKPEPETRPASETKPDTETKPESERNANGEPEPKSKSQ